MDFSGILNWGDVVIQIVLHDVELTDELVSKADVSLDFNGSLLGYRIAPM